MSLKGCDVASYQWDIEPSRMTTTDFVIAKATQGTWYVNPYFKTQYDKAKKAGKLLGAYHYSEGGSPTKEAQYFYNVVGNRIGECILALDHEGKSNKIFNTKEEVEWVWEFAKEIHRLCGVWIFLYMSKSVTRRRNWSEVAVDVRLWCAQYASNKLTNYQDLPWTDDNSFGAWRTDTIRQYSSHGRVRGYSKNLDINVAYLTKEEWLAAAKGDKAVPTTATTPAKTQWTSYISKYVKPVLISNSGSDENGNYRNGKAGDQTGREWYIRDWYSRPWDYVLRHPLAEVRACLATLAVKAAENDKIGYDQYNRESYGKALKEAGWDPSKITKAVESDCSKGVIDNIKATGYILGIKELQRFDATYTGNMLAAAREAGFQVLNDSKYVLMDDYLLAGDILLNVKHHTCTAVTNGKRAGKESAKSYVAVKEAHKMLPLIQRGDKGNAVMHLQLLLKLATYRNKKELTLDGSFGPKTQAQVIFFQEANTLEPDGIVGPLTWCKLYEVVF